MVVSSIACFSTYLLPTHKEVGSKKQPLPMSKPFTYLFSYLSTYMHETYFLQNWLPRWNQILTQLRFIHNWVITGIQWMVCWWVLVHCCPVMGRVRVSLADWLGWTLFALPVWVVFFSLHTNGFVPFIYIYRLDTQFTIVEMSIAHQ